METLYVLVGEEAYNTLEDLVDAISEELGVRVKLVYVKGLRERIIVNGIGVEDVEEVPKALLTAWLVASNIDVLVFACCA